MTVTQGLCVNGRSFLLYVGLMFAFGFENQSLFSSDSFIYLYFN